MEKQSMLKKTGSVDTGFLHVEESKQIPVFHPIQNSSQIRSNTLALNQIYLTK